MRGTSVCTCAAALLAALLLGGCAVLSNGIMGTGATPYTKELQVLVLGNVEGSQNQIPVPGATVSIKQTTTNQPAVGTGGASTTVTQSMATDPSGLVLFRVEPGESYQLTASATGYSSATLLVSPGYYSPRVISRVIQLAPSTTGTGTGTGTGAPTQ